MIRPYSDECAKEWDSFVLDKSANGNFLQSRRFLNYHPKERFKDASMLYYDSKDNLRAVVPAASIVDAGKRKLVSHPGSTYGGIVCDGKSLCAKRFQLIIEEVEEHVCSQGFDVIDLRVPPSFLWSGESALAEYMLRYNGYDCFAELTTYIDFEAYGDNTLKCFSQGKRTNVNNCKKHGLKLSLLDNFDGVKALHSLLAANLIKHGAKPVHSAEEIWDLYANRLKNETELVGIWDGSELLAAGWVFLFKNRSAAHTQYLCANDEYSRLSPMTFLYYSVIERYKEMGYRFISWGISTENSGRILNWGLTGSKESYGSLHDVHRRFVKSF